MYQHDGRLLSLVYPFLQCASYDQWSLRRLKSTLTAGDQYECPLDVLFLDVLAVAPPKFRPPRILNGSLYEHARTGSLRRVMEEGEVVRALAMFIRGEGDESRINELKEYLDRVLPGRQDYSFKLQVAWRNLQRRINSLYDTGLDRIEQLKYNGVRQVLEKKEGLFRKHMMGKRVNYACRSVITPDPYLAVDEVGVPVVFARRLTFPEPVNPHNLQEMKELVMRGPDNYPGANWIVNEIGIKKMLTRKEEQRQNEAGHLKPHMTQYVRDQKQVRFLCFAEEMRKLLRYSAMYVEVMC